MSAGQFSQPSVVHSLCLMLAKLVRTPESFSARMLAEAVAWAHPDVPIPVLRVIARKAMALYFDPITVDEIKGAKLDLDDEIAATEFLSACIEIEIAKMQGYRHAKRIERIEQSGLHIVPEAQR